MATHEVLETDPSLFNDMARIIGGTHWDPHHFLGLHPSFNRHKVIRLYRPGAQEVYIQVQGKTVGARKIHDAGIFDLVVDHSLQFDEYKVYHQNGLLAEDPYAFLPFWGDMDSHLFNKGVHYELYRVLGAHLAEHQGVKGVKFAVWAPSAMRVALVGDFNFWDGRVNPMRSMGNSGVWDLFVPGLKEGERYKFEIKTQQGDLLVKADPFANASELRPMTASVVSNVDAYQWGDQEWIELRTQNKNLSQPLNIYEVHLGSWKLSHGHHFNFREIAVDLASYCKTMGYTHVELLPVLEHPLDESWGYQVSGFFAVTSRYGTPEDFQFFVDFLHQNQIGVILDWVPGHFPSDDFALMKFDGTALYEHEDPRQGFHPHWNTLIFNYGRHEVSNFLIASALFWCDQMHIDGLRVDAVASVLYLDYGRDFGNWIPNRYGGNENIEAIEFIKHMNSVLHKKFPGILTIAEESTSFAGVTRNVEWDGLGFDFKWNMGWMNDTLRYFHKDPIFRRYHHNDLTFGLLYAFSEHFILVLSHDEVVHGKGSLLSKMPGDYWQKFANLRLLVTYMICQPGKKMLFMGGELGQFNEWWVKEEIHWHLLQYPSHAHVQQLVKSINHFYLNHPPLWERDFDFTGFEWVNFSDVDNSVICYRRKGNTPYELLCVHHFTPNFQPLYYIYLPNILSIEEVFNSDDTSFGGSGKKNAHVEMCTDTSGAVTGINIQLAPLATMIFKITYKT